MDLLFSCLNFTCIYMYIIIKLHMYSTFANCTSLVSSIPIGIDGMEATRERERDREREREREQSMCTVYDTQETELRSIGDFSSAVFFTAPPNTNTGLSG